MFNSVGLFGFGVGKSPRQQEIESMYIAHGVDFEPLIYAAFQKTLDNNTHILYRGRGFMAHTMNGNLVSCQIKFVC